MTELSRTLIGRGLVQSLSRSSLRTQGPITPGLKSEKRPLLECRSESPRRMGPCVRRDDLLENSISDSPAHKGGESRSTARRDRVCLAGDDRENIVSPILPIQFSNSPTVCRHGFAIPQAECARGLRDVLPSSTPEG